MCELHEQSQAASALFKLWAAVCRVWTSAWLAGDFLIDQGSQGSQETQENNSKLHILYKSNFLPYNSEL